MTKTVAHSLTELFFDRIKVKITHAAFDWGGAQGPMTLPATKSLLIEGVNSLITVQISDYPLQLVVSN